MKWTVSQETTDRMIDELVKKVEQSGLFLTTVVGIANGGLHISEPVSNALNLQYHVVHISRYGDREIIEPYGFNTKDFEGGILVVDDIVDVVGQCKLTKGFVVASRVMLVQHYGLKIVAHINQTSMCQPQTIG